jgi:hypothetical protein
VVEGAGAVRLRANQLRSCTDRVRSGLELQRRQRLAVGRGGRTRSQVRHSNRMKKILHRRRLRQQAASTSASVGSVTTVALNQSPSAKASTGQPQAHRRGDGEKTRSPRRNPAESPPSPRMARTPMGRKRGLRSQTMCVAPGEARTRGFHLTGYASERRPVMVWTTRGST